MIAVVAQGRLGNQLFQYAFAYASAKKLSCNFYIDKRYEKYVLSEYFQLSNDFFSKLDRYVFSIGGFRKFFSSFLRLGIYALIERKTIRNEAFFSDTEAPSKQLIKINNHTKYHGFFQSEDYFLQYRAEITKEFKIKKRHQISFNQIFNTIPKDKKIVVVQIRRTDYIELNICLSATYYHSAIKETYNENNFYIVISDDKKFINEEFGYLTNKYISNHDEIIDFQFLMNADICIISNSTFGWWGAYLNKKKPKIYAPKYWLGFVEKEEFPNGIIPNEFTEIEA